MAESAQVVWLVRAGVVLTREDADPCITGQGVGWKDVIGHIGQRRRVGLLGLIGALVMAAAMGTTSSGGPCDAGHHPSLRGNGL
jgi:hypothetical protein